MKLLLVSSLLLLIATTLASRPALFPGLGGRLRLPVNGCLKAKAITEEREPRRISDLVGMLSLRSRREGLAKRTARLSSRIRSAVSRDPPTPRSPQQRLPSRTYGPDVFITTLVG